MNPSALVTYLQRTLDLAALCREEVVAGPLVGWVVVINERIIEEGTSANAFLSTSHNQGTGVVWQNSTLLMSINPLADTRALASFCADRGISAYYVATDPESPVRSAALDLNRRYFTWLRAKRPYVLLKWAETADRFIARSDYQPYWISNPQARQLVHQWRSQEAAIWVGKNTYRYDNPRLNVRDWEGENPIRIVIDPELQLSNQLHVFDRLQPTLCYNARKNETYENLEFVQLSGNAYSWKDQVLAVFDDLYQRQIQSVFVEGGERVLSFLLENEWWDEARVFQAPITFGDGIKAPPVNQEYFNAQQRVGDNTLTIYRKAPLPIATIKI